MEDNRAKDFRPLGGRFVIPAHEPVKKFTYLERCPPKAMSQINALRIGMLCPIGVFFIGSHAEVQSAGLRTA